MKTNYLVSKVFLIPCIAHPISIERVNLGSRRLKQNFKALFLKKTKQTDHQYFKHISTGFQPNVFKIDEGHDYIGRKPIKFSTYEFILLLSEHTVFRVSYVKEELNSMFLEPFNCI